MNDTAAERFARLVQVMETLRSPEGCPWDREQTLSSLRPYVLEETYELLDALDRGDVAALREELGDFLFEAVFLAQIAHEGGHFSIADSIQAITDKLIRRHPHVFTADGIPLAEARERITAGQVVEKWEDLKARERKDEAKAEKTILSGVPKTLPSLLRAFELSSRAAAVGFDWEKAIDVVDKIEEEVREIRQEMEKADVNAERVEEEMGDLFFALANLSRKAGVEPEAALRKANDKFQRRFTALESRVKDDGYQLRDLPLHTLETYWQRVKEAAPQREDTKDAKNMKENTEKN